MSKPSATIAQTSLAGLLQGRPRAHAASGPNISRLVVQSPLTSEPLESFAHERNRKCICPLNFVFGEGRVLRGTERQGGYVGAPVAA